MNKVKSSYIKRILASALSLKPNSIKLEKIPKQNRFSKRKSYYKATISGGTSYHITEAKELQKTFQSSLQYYDAVPFLSTKPINCISSDSGDVLIQEFTNGSTIAQLLERGLAEDELNEIISELASALNAMEEPSTIEAAKKEFSLFSQEFLECRVLSNVDRLLFRESILPELEHHLIGDSASKRWSNGDLIDHNIMVTEEGEIVLIDYEFSKCTHFFAEDWIRLKMFSNSRIGNCSAYISEFRSLPSIINAYFWLNQVSLANLAFSRSKAQEYIPRYLQEFYDVFRSFSSVFSTSSMLIGGLAEKTDALGSLLQKSMEDKKDISERYDNIKNDVIGKIENIREIVIKEQKAEKEEQQHLENFQRSMFSGFESLVKHAISDILENVPHYNECNRLIVDDIKASSLAINQSIDKLGDADSIVQVFDSKVRDFESVLQGNYDEIIRLNQIINSLLLEAGNKDNEINNLISQLNDLSNDYEGKVDESQKISQLLCGEQELNNELSNSIVEYKSRLESFDSSFLKIINMNNQLKSEILKIRQENVSLRSSFKNCKSEVRKWMLKQRVTDAKNADIAEMLDSSKVALDNATETNANLVDRINQLESQISQLQEHYREIDLVKQTVEQQLADMDNANRGLLSEVQTLKNSVQVLLDKIYRMKTSLSWQLTAPLRFFRRKFVDSKSSPLEQPLPATIASPIEKIDDAASVVTPLVVESDSYHLWVQNVEPQIWGDYSDFSILPKVSILVPIYKPDISHLKDAIESVLRQGYTNWELCLADDHSQDPEVEAMIENFANHDRRVKYTFLKENGHISKCTNAALELVSGDFVAFLDHDDLLTENALAEMVLAVNQNPLAKFFYSDEDKVDEQGRRHTPHFKPNWNPQLILSQNYVCHFLMVDTSIVKEIGGLRVGVEGSQDWDLVLRSTEKLDSKEIVHIPKVLYHWRESAQSTAYNPDSKNYAMVAGETALHDYFKRQEIDATPTDYAWGCFVPQFKLKGDPSLTIIIPTKNGGKVLGNCLESLYRFNSSLQFDILVVDNGSDDIETLNVLDNYQRNHANFSVLRDDSPFNFSKLNNDAVSEVETDLVLFLNDDTEILTEDWLEQIKANAVRPEIGAVGVKLLYPDDTIQHAGVVLGVLGVAGHAFRTQPRYTTKQFHRANLPHIVSAVTGAFMCLRRDVFWEVGGFDKDRLAVAFNDVDLCIKIRECGYNNLYLPTIEVRHYESYSRGVEDTPEKRERFSGEVQTMYERWGHLLDKDPFYNPNFSLENDQYDIRTA